MIITAFECRTCGARRVRKAPDGTPATPPRAADHGNWSAFCTGCGGKHAGSRIVELEVDALDIRYCLRFAPPKSAGCLFHVCDITHLPARKIS